MALCFPACFPLCFELAEKYPLKLVKEEKGKYTEEKVESKYFVKKEEQLKYTIERGD